MSPEDNDDYFLTFKEIRKLSQLRVENSHLRIKLDAKIIFDSKGMSLSKFNELLNELICYINEEIEEMKKYKDEHDTTRI